MVLEIRNLKQEIKDDSSLEELVGKRLKLSSDEISIKKILKKSVDARKKEEIFFVWSLLIEVGTKRLIKYTADGKDVLEYEEETETLINYGSKKVVNRPIIVGSGPAGIFAALILAENGYKPLILERGQDVDRRSEAVERLSKFGIFSPAANIQFGEGGAGTFSDGKLTTRIKDKRCELVLKNFVRFGAPKEITYEYKPHIGTDILKNVIKNMRQNIIALGGEVRFESKVTDLIIKDGKVGGVTINNNEQIEGNIVALAIGHSARDTYEMLYRNKIFIEPKSFSIGMRIEHLQSMINEAQYGAFYDRDKLGAADYQMSHSCKKTGRTVYSFCMCPGGTVVPAMSEENMIAVNGMSEYARNGKNANSAIVVSVSEEDYKSKDPMDAIEYQRNWERSAFKAGGGNYFAPIQLVGDLLRGDSGRELGKVEPSYSPGFRFAKAESFLPTYVVDSIREGLEVFDRKIKGFADKDAVLTGVETRTSAPVRIMRSKTMESINMQNLYPLGEGAGYAGGIVSAAVDGIRFAESIMSDFKPLN